MRKLFRIFTPNLLVSGSKPKRRTLREFIQGARKSKSITVNVLENFKRNSSAFESIREVVLDPEKALKEFSSKQSTKEINNSIYNP